MLKLILAFTLSFSAVASDGFSKDVGPVSIKLSTKGTDIAFDQTAIQIPFAEKISLLFKNEASKGSEILHNVAVLKPGTLESFIKDMQANGYDIEKLRKHPSVIAMTSSLAPGAQESLEFKPKEPGFYPYVCIMAGHADMLGMKGVLNIVKSDKK